MLVIATYSYSIVSTYEAFLKTVLITRTYVPSTVQTVAPTIPWSAVG